MNERVGVSSLWEEERMGGLGKEGDVP